MNCQKCKIEIEDRDPRRELLSGAAEAHMAACASCRLFGEERLALRRLVGRLEAVSAPADFDFRMRARMAAERGVGAQTARRATWFGFSPAALSWPLAACLALIISASLYFQPRRANEPAEAATAAKAIPSRAEQARGAEAAAAARSPQLPVADSVPSSMGRPSNETGQGVVTASLKSSPNPERRRIYSTRPAERIVSESASALTEHSISTSLMGSATPRAAGGIAPRSEGALIPVQLDAPEGQLKVLLRDTSGGARTISVDSVSFGSRDVMGRPGATYTRASLSTNQGVW